MIKNIVFDLGNVIVDLDYDIAYKPLGVTTAEFAAIYDTDSFRQFETGKLKEADFFTFLCNNSDLRHEDIDLLKETLHKTFPLRPRVWKMLLTLGRHYRIFMLSNTNVLDFGSLEGQFDIRKPFEKVYLSYEQGYRKPDAETWLHAERVLDIQAEETLFLDDRIENVEGAAEQGWHTIHVKSEEHLFDSLREWNIINPDNEDILH
ncbi:HAD family phosphatase [bacterium]|nr:HAD family phosphatase [bacterium]